MSAVLTDISLDTIPAWKRDLILKKRSKSHGGLPENESGGISPPIHFDPVASRQMLLCSVQGSAQLAANHHVNQSGILSEWSNTRVSSDVKTSNDIYEKSKIVISAMKAPSAMYQKMRLPESPKHAWTKDEGELEYGPGIVSRLKNRYMTIAMRESKGSRPSLRKFSSLEDLLDDDGPEWQERGRSVQKLRPSQGGSPLKREAMKRTRSMDSLALRRTDSQEKISKSISSGGLRQANLDSLGKENMIIIETTRPSELKNGVKIPMQTVPENPIKNNVLKSTREKPAPALVNQVKLIFESSSVKPVRGTAAKVAAYKSAQARKNGTMPLPKPEIPGNKPALKPRPNIVKKFNSPTEEIVKPSPKKIVKQSSKSILNAKPVNKVGILSPPIGAGLTPITASVTSPCVNGFKKVSSSAISNIRDQSQHQAFDFTSKVSTESASIPRPHSPVTALPPSPTLSPRIQKPSKERQRVLEENKKNSDQSKPVSQVRSSNTKVTLPSDSKKPKVSTPKSYSPLSSPVEEKTIVITERTSPVVVESVKPVPTPVQNKDTKSAVPVHKATESPASKTSTLSGGSVKPSKGKDKKWNQPENSSLVFNFSKRTDDTPDYIENDGSDFSNRQFPSKNVGYVIISGYDGKADSSTDDFDEDNLDSRGVLATPPPCNVIFEGGAVIINGRSNLQRQPISKKLEISFDMSATQMFEYPSESSLLEDYLVDDNHTNISSGGLANYTPSKLTLNNSFELGVSRSAPPPTPPRQKVGPISDHLRPANETETVTWSEESAPDMLF